LIYSAPKTLIGKIKRQNLTTDIAAVTRSGRLADSVYVLL
jgi:hypothetical protein